MVIDFHSHVLPGIDDGSPNVDVSVQMLREAGRQGVDLMAATPHFLSASDRPERFLKRRQEAYEKLLPRIPEGAPKLLLGAETAYFSGISQAEKIDQMTIGGTDVLLLEMPFASWTDRELEEVRVLAEVRKFRVVLAHLERYVHIPGNKKRIPALMELPVQVQINAGAFANWRTRGMAVRWFGEGRAHLLGSDCHGIDWRPPNLKDGRDVLKKRLGGEALEEIDRLGSVLLGL